MTVLAFYDLAVSPVSFDMMAYLIAAKHFAGSDNLHVVIVPGPNEGFKAQDHKPISHAEKVWRVAHVLVPLCTMVGATVTTLHNREDARTFSCPRMYPEGYSVDRPVAAHFLTRAQRAMLAGAVPHFAASERATEHVQKWIRRERNLVSLTIRDTHTVMRNSNFATWHEVAFQLEKRGYAPVFVPDTAMMTRHVGEGFLMFPLAACDLDIRAALYDACVMNMAASGGPFALTYLGATRPYLYFHNTFPERFLTDPKDGDLQFHQTAEYLTKMGWPPGSQLPFAGQRRRTVWANDDDPDFIMKEFDGAMVENHAENVA